jgi:hypothetical protein
MAAEGVPKPDQPERRRSSSSHRGSQRILKQLDLADVLRLTSGAGASAVSGSLRWIVVTVVYNIAAEPTRDFLQDVRRRVGPAVGEACADRIRRARTRDHSKGRSGESTRSRRNRGA